MKKLSLKTYSIYMLKKYSNSNSLNTKKLQKEYSTNHRLLAPLFCYMAIQGYDPLEDSDLKIHLEDIQKVMDEYQESVLVDYLKTSKNEELQKFAHSFISENERRDENEIKNNYRLVFIHYQEEHQLSDYSLCKLAKMNPGNFNSFFHHNKNNTMSLKKCELLFNELFQLYG